MLLCGSALSLLAIKNPAKQLRILAASFAILAAAIGVFSLLEDLSGADFGIDQFLCRDPSASADTVNAGRMSPSTSFCFILIGTALALYPLLVSKSIRRPLSLSLSSAVALVGILVLIGYASEWALGDRWWNYTGTALHTALGFLFLSGGTIALLHREERLNWALGSLPTLGFIAGIALMLVAAAIGFNSAKEMLDAGKWVSHTEEVLKELREISSEMAGLESMQRGFLILGDDQVLSTRSEFKNFIGREVAAIRTLTSDNPRQQKQLEKLAPLVDRRIAFGDETIALRRQQGFDAARQLLATRTGITLSSEINQLLKEMEDEENRLLIDRTTKLRTVSTSTFLLLPLGVFLSVTTLLIGLIFLNSGAGARLRAEHAIRESELRLGGIVNSAMDAIVSMDASQRILLFNAAAEKMFRCSADSVLGQPLDKFIPPRYRDQHRAHVEGFGKTGVTTRSMRSMNELVGLRTDGDEFPIDASISQIDVDGQKIFTAILRDITERRRAEADATLLTAIVKSSADAIVGKDLNSIVTNWNPGAEAMFGYTAAEMVGRSITVIIPPDRQDDEEKILSRIKQGESFEHFETVRQRKDGRLIDVSVTVSPIKNSAGKIIGASKVVRDITERKRVEEALRQRELQLHAADRRLAEIIHGMTEAVFALDAEWRFTFVNSQCETLVHHSRAEMLGQSIWVVFHKLVGTPMETNYRRAMEERMPASFEAFSPVAERWLDIRLYPSGDGLAAFLLDINARKQLETARQESEARYRTLFENAPDGILIADPTGVYLDANASICRMLGYARREMIGLNATNIVAPAEMEHIEPALAQIKAKSEYHREWQFLRKDGSAFSAEVIATTMPDGNLLAMFRDITERKRAEEALRESREQFSTMVNAMSQLAWMAQPDGFLYWYNQRWYEFTGTTPEQMEGWGWQRVHDPEMLPKVLEGWKMSIATGQPFEMNFPLRAANGQFHWFLTRAFPLKDASGKIIRWIGTNTDVSRMREAEEEIQRLNTDLEKRVIERTAQLESANKELEAFSYSVSHDLRAPLRAVDGFSRVLQEEFGPQLPDEGKEYLTDIRNGAQKMGQLIDDLLTFSRLSRAPLKKGDVNTGNMVRETLEDLSTQLDGRHIDIRIADLPACEGDSALLKQVWINLLANAIKYTSRRESAVVEIGCTLKDGEHVFFVRDNGVGFDMRYANKLFGVFQRLHRAEEYEGTGVGLAIVNRVITRHGGRIWADAAVDRGATFYFTLDERNAS